MSPLSGCSSEHSIVKRAIGTIIGNEYGLSDESLQEIDRFRAAYQGYLGDQADDAQLEYFAEAIRYARTSYVHETSDADMVTAAIEGVEKLKEGDEKVGSAKVIEAALDSMTASLDPHSAYLNPEESKTMYANTKGEFGGLGISVTMK